jgi:hypothetical protein
MPIHAANLEIRSVQYTVKEHELPWSLLAHEHHENSVVSYFGSFWQNERRSNT